MLQTQSHIVTPPPFFFFCCSMSQYLSDVNVVHTAAVEESGHKQALNYSSNP